MFLVAHRHVVGQERDVDVSLPDEQRLHEREPSLAVGKFGAVTGGAVRRNYARPLPLRPAAARDSSCRIGTIVPVVCSLIPGRTARFAKLADRGKAPEAGTEVFPCR